MAFRNGAYATCWGIDPKTDSITTVRLSTSKKNKETGNYDTDFSGFVGFCGSACASKAATLKERDRIKLKDVSVTSKYDKEKNKTYTNFNCFDFDIENNMSTQSNNVNDPSVMSEDFMRIEGDEEGLPF